MFSALRVSLKTDRSLESVQANILAGLTVGVIALPLSMALAIASGVAPQYGLYTAVISGIVIALTGGSRVNIPGPTAAFVVVLLPIVQHYGLGGLLMSGFMAGFILILMGLSRFGALIEVVPYPVTIGFTAGIGVVIGTIQIKDFLGLNIESLGEHYTDKVVTLFHALPTLSWEESIVGIFTLAILIVWPRLKSRIPGHLVALFVASVLVAVVAGLSSDFSVATIGSRFHYTIDGVLHGGIPPVLPGFEWPWDQPGADGNPIGLSFDIVHSLVGAALTIAVLGAIESLLCAVAADGMSGQKHNPNDELIGQGIGNMIVPLFGGIPATAAIARTAASVRAGGSSPLASVVHALFILASIVFLAKYLAYIPMASIAALLLMVAWNMSEAKHFFRIVKIAPRDDVITLLTCFLLTVFFDMVIAVGVGMGLAAMLFIRRSIQLTRVDALDHEEAAIHHDEPLPRDVAIYEINGPLFFGSAQKALSEISLIAPEVRVVILDMSKVSMLDMSAIVAMESIVKDFESQERCLIINALQPRMILKLRRAGVRRKKGAIGFSRSIRDALEMMKGCQV
ncbi:SulP family sulfate permease [Thiogranum longum]|uniref:SulP family sulfate permease n=1 Tax=Thiogranum longum TaxID=1537524 RepID=A0A4R1H905_9GAMM|nr:C4-dicarboxylic acid transporter DauA [Thiogranum longum]TCK16991.1 SulP family sulfate permease [Thiogranum longum]